MDEQDAWLRLIRIPGLHGGSLAPWLDRFGGASRLLEAGAEAWQAAGIAPALRQRLGAARSASVDADRQWLLESGRHFVTFRDARFPALLA
ncbi:MAG TPA: hypothetical protein VLT59_07345, partial [Steroidobacteraceae bacterium]|nr:hypothetical protein [Steroidobacteraceae bacterium]